MTTSTVIEIDEDARHVDLIRQRLNSMKDLGFLTHVERLNLRWNRLTIIQGLDDFGSTLVELNLYDNQISKIEGLNRLRNLKELDLSFNRITKLENLDRLGELRKLYICHNKITKLENLDKLKNLRILEIGDNRISKIENLAGLIRLKELHIGANHIRRLENLEPLEATLEALHVPANGITKIENLQSLTQLKTLSVAQNGIRRIENLDALKQLEVLDVNDNIIDDLDGVQSLKELQSLWMRKIKNLTPKILQEKLGNLSNLRHLVIEGTEFAKRPNYRNEVIDVLPRLKVLDSYPVWWIPGDPWQSVPEGEEWT